MGTSEKLIRIECEGASYRDLDELLEFQGELKSLSEVKYKKLRKELIAEGMCFPIRTWDDPEDGNTKIIGGHQTTRTLKRMRDEEGYIVPPLPVSKVFARDWKQAKRRVLADISQYGKVEKQGLYEFMTHADIPIEDIIDSFDVPEMSMDMDKFKLEYFSEINHPPTGDKENEEPRQKLSDRFLVPPFSVLDARQGYWQDRKRQWLALGIQSELGRGGGASPGGSPRPAMRLDNEGKTVRGDGYGRPIEYA